MQKKNGLYIYSIIQAYYAYNPLLNKREICVLREKLKY